MSEIDLTTDDQTIPSLIYKCNIIVNVSQRLAPIDFYLSYNVSFGRRQTNKSNQDAARDGSLLFKATNFLNWIKLCVLQVKKWWPGTWNIWNLACQ